MPNNKFVDASFLSVVLYNRFHKAINDLEYGVDEYAISNGSDTYGQTYRTFHVETGFEVAFNCDGREFIMSITAWAEDAKEPGEKGGFIHLPFIDTGYSNYSAPVTNGVLEVAKWFRNMIAGELRALRKSPKYRSFRERKLLEMAADSSSKQQAEQTRRL